MLAGGKFKRFGDSLIPGNDNSVTTPHVTPKIGASLTGTKGRIAQQQRKIAAATADISRTAPTFNDPRYSFTTLSIPTDLRTLNGLYRFFDDTDPLVVNIKRSLNSSTDLSFLSSAILKTTS